MIVKVSTKQTVLVLHSDNGSPMKGATMLETLYSLGIVPSNSSPRVSNDNPYACELVQYKNGVLDENTYVFENEECQRQYLILCLK